MAEARSATTEDRLLGGRVIFHQPGDGYRAAIDPVFLAAACDADDDDHVLDMGAGAGAAMLCLASRLPGVNVTGIEIDEELAGIARKNILANGFDDRARIRIANALDDALGDIAATFDRVITNPPFNDPAATRPSPNKARARATAGSAELLAAWLGACIAALRHDGWLYIIAGADRLPEITGILDGPVGGISIFPLWPRAGAPARRILIRARKGSRTPPKLLAGLALHGRDSCFTDAAERILSSGEAVPW